LQFWDRSQPSLDKLYLPALRALSVPASTPVPLWRVFSQDGSAGSLRGHTGHA